MSPVRRLTALGIAGTVLIGLGMPLLQGFGDDAFLALACAGGVIAALAARLEEIPGPRALAIIVGAGLAMRLLALPAPPILSTDIFRYVWDGIVQSAGINPIATSRPTRYWRSCATRRSTRSSTAPTTR